MSTHTKLDIEEELREVKARTNKQVSSKQKSRTFKRKGHDKREIGKI